jgi:hypothetical protein
MQRVQLKLQRKHNTAGRYHHFAPVLGAHSRPHNLAKIDQRTREAALLRRVREELTAHVGGNPSAVERVLIERCCWVQLRLAMLDKKLASGRDFTEIDSNVYLAWANTLARTLVRLGVKPAATRPPTLADLFPNDRSAA